MFWHLPHPRIPQGFPLTCSTSYVISFLLAWKITHCNSWKISHLLSPEAVLHPIPSWLHFLYFKAHVSQQNQEDKIMFKELFFYSVRLVPPLPWSGLILFLFFLLSTLSRLEIFSMGLFSKEAAFCVYLWICSHLYLMPHLCSFWAMWYSFLSLLIKATWQLASEQLPLDTYPSQGLVYQGLKTWGPISLVSGLVLSFSFQILKAHVWLCLP